MFESHPDTQYIFPKFRGIDLMALEQSLVIVQHGTRVMGIVDTVVKNMVKIATVVWSQLWNQVPKYQHLGTKPEHSLGCGGGLLDRAADVGPYNPSSIPLGEKKENKQKETRVGTYLKKTWAQ